MTSTQSSPKNLLAQSDPQTLLRIRHTCAHVLAMAVQSLFPETKVTIGPWTETGFYYDFDYEGSFNEEDLAKIENRMTELAQKNFVIERSIMERDAAIEFFKEQGENIKLRLLKQSLTTLI